LRTHNFKPKFQSKNWSKANMNRFIWMALILVTVIAVACGQAPAAAPAPAEATVAPTAAPTEAPAASQAMTTTQAMTATEATTATQATTATTGVTAVTLPEVNPLDVKGDIISAGSSTVFPLAEAMAARFKDEGYAGNLTIDSIGTGAGFERFCKAGETDIANASRKIKDTETENCKAIGRAPIEFRVGTDALAVVINPQNTWATDVTVAQLAKIYSPDTKNWSDVDPSWPNEPILRFSPGTDSGTFDYFVEAVMDKTFVKDAAKDKGKGKEAILAAANLQLSEDDNVLAQGVEGDKNAIGYFGYAYFQESGDKLKVLKVAGVEPSFDTAESGKYPLARPLFIYSDAKILKDKPQVAAFINFFLTNVDEEIGKVGYFPASDDALSQAKQNLLTAMGQ
jgi:phosphate binding protein